MDNGDNLTDMQPGRVKVSSETQFVLTKESTSNNAHEREPFIGFGLCQLTQEGGEYSKMWDR